MIDRGFIKWQPFNSLINNKIVLDNLTQKPKLKKPSLFPEELAKLNEQILDAYYAQTEITLIYYENNLYKKITTSIISINTCYKTLKLKNGKIISFSQIIHVLT